jgi:putative transposase
MSRLPKVANPHRRLYPSDLSDHEWEIIKTLLLLPALKGFGSPRTVNIREILNAIFYVQRSGCQWEMWAHDFPHHGTVYKYFQKWERLGFWKQIHDTLRHQLREKPSFSLMIIFTIFLLLLFFSQNGMLPNNFFCLNINYLISYFIVQIGA